MGAERTRGHRRDAVRAIGITFALVALALGAQAPAALASDAGGHTPSAADRYSLANGCFALRSVQNGAYVRKAGVAYSASAGALADAEPFRMQATSLGHYLFYGPAPDFMSRNALTQAATPAGTASPQGDWTVLEDAAGFRIRNGGRALAVGAGNALVTVSGAGGDAALFDFVATSGCADYPEIEVNVSGPLPAKTSPSAKVRGTVETHMHHMAYEFLGTKVHCGQPWHRFGAPSALQDCQDHAASGGCGAVLETALSGDTCHDPGGWPSFAGWPQHSHYTHEQSYYKWVERAWRAGMRVFVNLMVENRVLCELYPLTPQPASQNCNEMDTVRRELQRARELQDYIDAQNGGPGKGWYRIVESPAEARQAIADGKLAVVLGMEVSEPFDCRIMQPGDMPLCSASDVTEGLDELYDLGVRQLELVNKFDNALTGVAGDSGSAGTITGFGNFLSAGTFFDFDDCTGENPEVNHDHSPTALSHNDDALISAGLELFGDTTGISFPVYGPPPHCNERGLTNLGELAIETIIDKGMIFDPDHMSVIARNKALDIVEEAKYPGVMTSHSWSTDNALPRISALGGLIGPAAKSPAGFVADWNHIKAHGYDELNPYLFGFGYGADMNGFASQGGPTASTAPITYPFQSPIDPRVTVDKQKSGQRTFDLNTDGTAHYGLYADWTEAVRVAGGNEIVGDLANGAEAYLQMWERATGTFNGGGGAGGKGAASGSSTGECAKWPRKLTRRGLGKRLRLGFTESKVVRRAGRPQSREGDVWVWCAKAKRRGKRNRIAAVFGDEGKVVLIATTSRRNRAAGIGRGTKAPVLRASARKLGRGLWLRKAGKRRHFVYRLRRGRVAYAGVVASKPGSAKELSAQLRLAGLK